MKNKKRLGLALLLSGMLAVGLSTAQAQTTVDPVPLPDSTPQVGDTICVQIDVTNVTDMYAASFDVSYNPLVLDYTGTTEGTFLNQDAAPTELRAAALNWDETTGQIVVGDTRIGSVGGVSGSGTIATLCFTVVGGYCSASDLGFLNADLEGPVQDSIITATWNGSTITVTLTPPTGLATNDPGTHDQIDLSWTAAAGATRYKIFRSHTVDGVYEEQGISATTTYNDAACILPTQDYYYKVLAMTDVDTCISDLSLSVMGIADGRLGDINNDGRVDGRDLSRLARAFGAGYGQPRFDCRADLGGTAVTNEPDNMIDGDDLSLLAVDFGYTIP